MNILESAYQVTVLLLLLCTFSYYVHLRRVKRERKFSVPEIIMYILTQVAFVLWVVCYFLERLS
ncbi:hypothetical protein BTTOUR_35610 [Bacillus thuringiensis serovar toumanoffi]|uniref:Uncharacterized protein n=1 Tax=Bacillus thuringiensis serovar toumanoffi TaxID=180862 RepID=A0ABD5IA81_BACTU|nr:hypothetical protein [Bacillus thuringiensis serovar toumanoffi]OTZ40591.1 hypothetical protein BK762_33830 [Bacillus thuringiensis serovar toumanoffi]